MSVKRAPWKITVPKWDCLKDISKVFHLPKKEREAVDRRKCTPLLSIRAMLCIKLMVKIHCNNRTQCGVHLPQMSFYYYSEICDLFFYRMVFLSMYTFLFCLYACLWDSVLFLSCSHFTGHVCFFKLVFNLMFSALLDTVKSNRKVRKESNSKERAGLTIWQACGMKISDG